MAQKKMEESSLSYPSSMADISCAPCCPWVWLRGDGGGEDLAAGGVRGELTLGELDELLLRKSNDERASYVYRGGEGESKENL